MNRTQARRAAIERARQYVAHQPLFMDTETTGTDELAEIIEIAIVDHEGNPLLCSLVKPQEIIPASASALHGIDNGMVQAAPTWAELWPTLKVLLNGHSVGIYNADFDIRLMRQSHRRAGLDGQSAGMTAFCIMKLYAEFYGDWNAARGSFRWQSLEAAGRQCGSALPNAHRAQADALLARSVLLHMAASELR